MDQTPAEKITLLLSNHTLAILATVSLSILAWDHCLLLPVESQVYISLKKCWNDPRPWLFILLRYMGLGSLLANVFLSSVRHDNCRLASGMFRAFYVLLMAIFCALVTLRISILWKYHADVMSTLVLFGLAVTGLWVAVSTETKPFYQPNVLFGSNCALQPFPSWHSSAYAAALVFNLAAFLLGSVKILRKQSGPGRGVRRDSRILVFLIVCIAASAAMLVVTALGSDQQVSKQATSGFFILLVASMGSRIHLTFEAAELRAPLFKSPQRLVRGDLTSYTGVEQSPSTINQSIMTFPASSIAKVTTVTSTPSSNSYMPLSTSLNSPPHHQPSMSLASNDDLHPINPPIPSNGIVPSRSAAPTLAHQTSASTMAFVSPVQSPRPLPPIPQVRKERASSLIGQGVNLAPVRRAHSASRSPGKRTKKLADMQSGWIDS
ncbi:hypothetical protein P691DRAFT_787418 [Macrolepiota fuliginosa MF-IS2]|uniref:DUF6533 domain-containing protein n=1 Tax=Macrolepiota fuliginosa MF-IS2 TaxID=1400762 RepID=A0A9P6BZS5_9AGAR|nr:hypothetical protein P691DRAFT_787418 [Macrolepiota fuliginosa MF-IS2]